MKLAIKLSLALLIIFASSASYGIDTFTTPKAARISNITYFLNGGMRLHSREGWFPEGHACEFKENIAIEPRGVAVEDLTAFEIMSSIVTTAYQEATPVIFSAIGHVDALCAPGTGPSLEAFVIHYVPPILAPAFP